MAVTSPYISDAQFRVICKRLSLELSPEEAQDLVDRASGEVETDLCERFSVPLLRADGGAFSATQAFVANKIRNLLMAKIRQLIGQDNNVNTVVESTQRYIDVHKGAYEAALKPLLDTKKDYGLMLTSQADGAMNPVQKIGLARADNRLHVRTDFDPFDF